MLNVERNLSETIRVARGGCGVIKRSTFDGKLKKGSKVICGC